MNAPVAFCCGTVARTQGSVTVTCAIAEDAAMPRMNNKTRDDLFMVINFQSKPLIQMITIRATVDRCGVIQVPA